MCFLLLQFSTSALAQTCNNLILGGAQEYVVFTFGNFTSANDQIWGRAAIGGNFTVSNYAIGAQGCLSNDPTRIDLVVGGNLTYNGGQVNNGSVRYAGTTSGTFTLALAGSGATSQQAAGIVDFGAVEADLKAKSAYWSSLAQTGTVNDDSFGTITLTGSNTTYNVFNLTATQVQKFSYLNLFINVPAGATVLINVSGTLTIMPQTTVTFNGTQINTGTTSGSPQTAPQAYILWNLSSSTTAFTMNQVGFQGSLLAPWADITSQGGEMNGALIAKSVVNNSGSNVIQVHCTRFQGCLPNPPSLPVRLRYFSGTSRNEKAELSWSTSWERDNKGFEIMRSLDVRSWETIAFVTGKGTSETVQQYIFTDENVRPGQLLYYKLRQRDLSGQFEDSKVLAVRITGRNEDFYLYPNPAPNGTFRLVVAQAEGVRIRITSVHGQDISAETVAIGPDELQVRLINPALSGLYYITVIDASGPRRVLKVLTGAGK